MTQREDLRVLLNTYEQGDYIIETVEILGYAFTKEPGGILATLENGRERYFEPANFQSNLNSQKADLDQNFSFTFSDVDNLLDDELDKIPLDSGSFTLTYRTYNSFDLSEPSDGPYLLSVIDVSQELGVFTIQAAAPQLNWSETGEIYSFDVFPMLLAL